MTRRERAAAKRRKAAEARAIDYLRAALADLPGCRKGTAEKRIRESAQPMTTARAIVKGWCPGSGNGVAATLYGPTLPDLSAATEARAAILRRQAPHLRRWTAFDNELAKLEKALLTGHMSQRAFNNQCKKICQRALQQWMSDPAIQHYESP